MNSFYNIDSFKDRPEEVANALSWINDFICKPHSDLHREGAICPCAVHSVESGAIYFAHIDLRTFQGTQKKNFLISKVISLANEILLDTNRSVINSYVITLQGIQHSEYKYVLDGAYIEAKPIVLKKALMIGCFHAFNNRTSRLNNEFYPMRPLDPIFAMRQMVIQDKASLSENTDYLKIYEDVFYK